ncbi:MAG: winged helix-turn-helix transcriptional regulator [Myxococcales bacterium]|nr:winged helix-turn-helix transcriptional regulator [Myxococcales bacterium]
MATSRVIHTDVTSASETPSSSDPPHPSIADDRARAEHVAEILKALAHPLRISIVALLAQAPRHVNALAEALDANQAIVSQQLRVLRTQRLVAVDRTGGRGLYRIDEPRLIELVGCMAGCRL